MRGPAAQLLCSDMSQDEGTSIPQDAVVSSVPAYTQEMSDTESVATHLLAKVKREVDRHR